MLRKMLSSTVVVPTWVMGALMLATFCSSVVGAMAYDAPVRTVVRVVQVEPEDEQGVTADPCARGADWWYDPCGM